ncbi:MAG TPA: peptide-methionine (R)-S-oxide reductase MsrB [Candidatus Paceibacterota bacterium]
MDPDDLKARLDPETYRVTQQKSTEPPFSGKYVDHGEPGRYACAVCEAPLFASDAKFHSGTGWPSFDQAIPGSVHEVSGSSHGMERTEATCAKCGAHLGHVFEDAVGTPHETGKRFCVNSCALDFKGEGNEG